MTVSYPFVTDVPMKVPLMLSTTHLFEQGLYELFSKKNKILARLCVKDNLRDSMSKTVRRIEALALSTHSHHIEFLNNLSESNHSCEEVYLINNVFVNDFVLNILSMIVYPMCP